MVPRSGVITKICTSLSSFHKTSNRWADLLVHKSKALYKELRNPYVHLVIWRIPQDIDCVQNDVSKETTRGVDHRAHLRAIATTPIVALPKPTVQIENQSNQFFFPSDIRPGLLGIPDLNSPSRFEELATIAVGESRRLLLDPESFSNPKRAVQVMDFVSNLICNVADAAEMIRQLHPEDRWRLAANTAVQHVQSFIGQVNVDSMLYDKLKEMELMERTTNFCKQSQVEMKGNVVDEKAYTQKTVESIAETLSETLFDKTRLNKENPISTIPNSNGDASINSILIPNNKKQYWFDEITEEETVVLRLMREAMEQQGVHIKNLEHKAICLKLLEREQELSTSIAQGPSTNFQDVWVPRHVIESLGLNPTRFPTGRGSTGATQVNIMAESPIATDLLKLCPFPEVRKSIWEAKRRQSVRGDKQVQELISVRQKLASFRGFDSWSHFAKREGILRSDHDVQVFVGRCLESLMPGLKCELETLREYKRQWNDKYSKHHKDMVDGTGGRSTILCPWDMPFLMNQIKSDKFQETSNKLKDRLTVRMLLRFYGALMESLFGIVLNPHLPKHGETWHWSVMKFQICQKKRNNEIDSTPIGTLYLDLFDRSDKPHMDAQFSIRGSRLMNYAYRNNLTNELLAYIGIYKCPHGSGSDVEQLQDYEFRQSPCCVLVSNIASPLSLANCNDIERYVNEIQVTVSEARNLFHELGHVTHALLSSTGLQHLSGTRGSVDFTEFPSHLFEHFVIDAATFSHGLTLKHGDRALMDNYQRGAELFGHLDAAGLALKTAVDQITHSTPLEVLSELGTKRKGFQHYIEDQLALHPSYKLLSQQSEQDESSIKDLLGTPLITKFEHLIHYGGMFHTYLFNRVVSSWVWTDAFQGALLNNKEAGTRLKTLLKNGSTDTSMKPILSLFSTSRDSDQLFKDPSQIPLTHWIDGLKKSLP